MNSLNKKQRNIHLRKNVQFIFQNSKGTLHPKKTIEKIFNESILSIKKLTGKSDFYGFEEVLRKVDIPSSALKKYVRNFSGGECQRISIARSLLVNPKFLIADEALSSSDVITQAKILNLFRKLKNEGLSILFITHDIAAAHYISDRIIVMDKGEIVEDNICEEIINKPKKDITKQLLNII